MAARCCRASAGKGSLACAQAEKLATMVADLNDDIQARYAGAPRIFWQAPPKATCRRKKIATPAPPA